MCSLAPVLQHLTLDTAMQGMLQGPAGSSNLDLVQHSHIVALLQVHHLHCAGGVHGPWHLLLLLPCQHQHVSTRPTTLPDISGLHGPEGLHLYTLQGCCDRALQCFSACIRHG